MSKKDDVKEEITTFQAFFTGLYNIIDAPVTFFKEKIVCPNQQLYPWFHYNYKRVPTIDQCFSDDVLCDFEANAQFKRDRAVDCEILTILRQRFEDCMLYESPDINVCKVLHEKYKDSEEAWFLKYGDLGAYGDARKAYMKQKHRMVWQKRHGRLSKKFK